MIQTTPLISCICVTYNKPLKLDFAIACFTEQTYQNKQLIILYEDHDMATVEYLRNRHFSNAVKLIEVKCDPKKTLGELRNMAIDQADGEFICQWDDDDWYHINRLKYQFDFVAATDCSGSVLRHWLILDATKNKLYISHARNWEGSLLCNKELFLLKKYDKSSKGEDTAVVEFLCDEGYVTPISEINGMYMYVYHGNNTWDEVHFNAIFECCHEVDINPDILSQILVLPPGEGSAIINEVLLLNDSVIGKLTAAF